MVDTTFTSSYIVTDTEIETLIGGEYLTTPVVPDLVKRACLEEAITIYQAGTRVHG